MDEKTINLEKKKEDLIFIICFIIFSVIIIFFIVYILLTTKYPDCKNKCNNADDGLGGFCSNKCPIDMKCVSKKCIKIKKKV